jgi:hypothetical protein
MKFMIKPLAGQPVREGDTIVRYTGNSEPFLRGDVMYSERIGGTDENPIIKFATGLDADQIKFCNWFSEEQKVELEKLLEQYKPILETKFGVEALDSKNKYFWTKPEYYKIRIDNDTEGQVFDLKKPEQALLFFNIMGGAFLEVVAPNKTMAEVKGIPHYLVLETDVVDEVADDISVKTDAYVALRQLEKSEGGDALMYIAWCLQTETKGFGAYTRSTPKSELIKYHGEFIEGKLSKTKRNCPKDFVAYADKWLEGGLVKNKVMIEAYLKAADFYSYLNTNAENKYQLPSGVVLGATIEASVDSILKPRQAKDFEALRDVVESKGTE